MKQVILSFILVWMCGNAIGQTLPKLTKESDFSIGKSLRIYSEILKEERDLNIYLPAGYSADSSKTIQSFICSMVRWTKTLFTLPALCNSVPFHGSI